MQANQRVGDAPARVAGPLRLLDVLGEGGLDCERAGHGLACDARYAAQDARRVGTGEQGRAMGGRAVVVVGLGVLAGLCAVGTTTFAQVSPADAAAGGELLQREQR